MAPEWEKETVSIKAILRTGFAVLLLFIAYVSAERNTRLVNKAINDAFDASLLISDIAIEGNELRRYAKELFICVAKLRKYEDEWKDAYEQLDGLLQSVIRDNTGRWSRADVVEFRKWQESLQAYGNGFRDVVEAVYNGKLKDTLAANAAISDAKDKFRVLLNGAAEGGAVKYRAAESSAAEIRRDSERSLMMLTAISASGIALALGLMAFVPAAIAKPTACSPNRPIR